MSFCPGCSNQLAQGAQFCNACGAPLGPPSKLGDDAMTRALLPVGRSGWAIAAGYAGLFGLLVGPAPIALILGIIAVIHLRKRPDLHGWGRTIFGLVVGILGTAVFAIALLASL
jgi:hypothetical protein